ncbi:DUF3267 domain-containing protein [Planococcus sp. CAU13]|uniref:DUF3267 domain-containing protein n=1 Tax=Planococcus sp. CAU13 TaxID=1541197 RepID=UPI00052FEF70|nr:DUF3267 domain-containing protein [Planococcus sp. CAU13]
MKPDFIIELKLEEIVTKLAWINVGLVVAFAAAYHLFAEPLSFGFSLFGILYFTVGYAILIVLHELFHLIGFVIFGKVPLSSLTYGLELSKGYAYATSSAPLRNKQMRKVLLLPFWTTAVIPTIIGFWIHDQILVLLGAMLAAGAAGDFFMYRELRKQKDEAWILDDPVLPRLRVYNEYPDPEDLPLE